MRAASDATKLRRTKAELRSLRAYVGSLTRELAERRLVGAMLGNIVAFNLKLRDRIDEDARRCLVEWQSRWDAIRSVPLASPAPDTKMAAPEARATAEDCSK